MSKTKTIGDIELRLDELEDDMKIIDRGIKTSQESLRDKFAVSAPIDYDFVSTTIDRNFSSVEQSEMTIDEIFNLWATLRYKYADAMMEARKQ